MNLPRYVLVYCTNYKGLSENVYIFHILSIACFSAFHRAETDISELCVCCIQ